MQVSADTGDEVLTSTLRPTSFTTSALIEGLSFSPKSFNAKRSGISKRLSLRDVALSD
jgi:hypothetical protein